MRYHLLTGATGLLGSYLLRDLLLAGDGVAAVVRSSNREPARIRIETILGRFERESGYALPRPVVLEGDITLPDLGLGADALRWISQHCDSVLHNAANLTFRSAGRDAEPWRSNLDGTRNVLDVCRKTSIRSFHYVSTAYVCGLRAGRILESELDAGQEFGNDYERSKAEAEKSVRAAGLPDPPTIYRPAIIVGDSRTGHTTTFHGFYAPLKIMHALVGKFDLRGLSGNPLMTALGLSGTERKNLVPVDWVSQTISWIVRRPEHHGRTYHLVPQRAVTATTLCDVAERTVLAQAPSTAVSAEAPAEYLASLPQVFREQMDVYRAYWRDDPEFDTRNTAAAAPHLPCPCMDAEMLLRLAQAAVRLGFGWPRPRPVSLEFDVHDHLKKLLPTEHATSTPSAGDGYLGLQVNGPGGGQWSLLVDQGRVIWIEEGIAQRCVATYWLNSATFQQLVARRRSAAQAIEVGQVLIEGAGRQSIARLADILQMLVAPCVPAGSLLGCAP